MDGPFRFGCWKRRKWALQANVGPVWFGRSVTEAPALVRASPSQRRHWASRASLAGMEVRHRVSAKFGTGAPSWRRRRSCVARFLHVAANTAAHIGIAASASRAYSGGRDTVPRAAVAAMTSASLSGRERPDGRRDRLGGLGRVPVDGPGLKSHRPRAVRPPGRYGRVRVIRDSPSDVAACQPIVRCGDTPVFHRSLGDRCERHKRAPRLE